MNTDNLLDTSNRHRFVYASDDITIEILVYSYFKAKYNMINRTPLVSKTNSFLHRHWHNFL